MATWPSWPQAWCSPGVLEAKGTVHMHMHIHMHQGTTTTKPRVCVQDEREEGEDPAPNPTPWSEILVAVEWTLGHGLLIW